ncbi:type II secretion system F family protein [Bacillus sp. PS06]|uniref:type II secretion system F family protein n=1 Tax=Bacillus sp. PS06 TaxID=2764176 RepID=UPI00177D49D9|nr:type II secretion system F family protein [Bacillus sp. PS06]MBD8071132.1 type II secretion system F family protein [Bacillus sp. PS06]
MAAFYVTTASALMFIIGFYYLLDFRKEKKEWKKKVHHYYHDGKKRKSMIVLLGDRFDQTETAAPIAEKLRAANIPFTPSEYIGAIVVSYAGIMIMLQNFFNIKFPLNLIVAILIVEIGRRLLFFVRKNKMKQRIVEQLPEVCRTLANATRSGMTLTQGVNLVAQEVSEPARSEFKRLASELALGIEFNTALHSMEKRIENREFKLFVATLLIQKKAGGNLFSVLEEMGQTLEERKIIQQEIKTMTAEQRYTSYIVPVIPIFLVLMMNNIIDGFLDPLFSGIGIILLLLFVGGTVLTFILVRKVTNIRV